MKTQILENKTINYGIGGKTTFMKVQIGTYRMNLSKTVWSGARARYNNTGSIAKLPVVNKNWMFSLNEIVKGPNQGIDRNRIFTLPKAVAKELKKVVNFKIDKVTVSGPFGPCEQLKIGK